MAATAEDTYFESFKFGFVRTPSVVLDSAPEGYVREHVKCRWISSLEEVSQSTPQSVSSFERGGS